MLMKARRRADDAELADISKAGKGNSSLIKELGNNNGLS